LKNKHPVLSYLGFENLKISCIFAALFGEESEIQKGLKIKP